MFPLLRLSVLSSALLLPAALLAQPRFELGQTTTVLPKTVLPSSARLRLQIDPAQAGFSGQVAITLRVTEAVPAITLHAEQLQAGSVTLQPLAAEGAAARPLQVQADAAKATWRLADGQPIAPGNYRLDIAYRGAVQVGDQGLYAVNFRQQGEPVRWLASQLEATYARLLMPSFDEPVFRTRFEVQVQAPAGLQVLGNMPLLRSEPVEGGVLHSFAPTPAMPSYLLAVTAGRFDVLEDRSGDLPLRIFTTTGKREQARFAMDATKQLLPYYAGYFGRPFALPKLDQIAVPGTRSGAMEDWGLISYDEGGLLFDPRRGTDDTQRRIFSVVAHEVAHQWFGNLVSVASWSELWLNEAFATWMSDKAQDRFHPEWQTALHQRVQLGGVMALDATPATRAIRSGPVGEASVASVFDGITYAKGGAVLAMLEQWLGEDVFQRGLAAYMADRALQPATAGDLWFHIGRAAGQPVAAVAASWTDQPGLPLLRVASRCTSGSDGWTTTVTLTQERFSADAPLPPALWQIPMRLVRGGTLPLQRSLLLTNAKTTFTLPGCSAQPLLANAGGRGYYLVDYDAQGWSRLVEGFSTLQPAEQVAVLSDSFALASAGGPAGAGQRTMAAHFALLRQLPKVQGDSRAALFQQAAGELRRLDLALDGLPAQATVQHAAWSLLAPELDRLGWTAVPGESPDTASLRGTLVRDLAALDHAPTVAAVLQRLPAALLPAGDPGALPPALRGAVLAAAGRHADDATFDRMLATLQTTDNGNERRSLLWSLGSTRDPARAERLLAMTLNERLPPEVRLQLPLALAQTPALAPLVYGFMVQHWAALAEVAGEFRRHGLLPAAVGGSADVALAERMVQDQQRLDGAAGSADAAKAVERVRGLARLRAREAPQLAQALQGWQL